MSSRLHIRWGSVKGKPHFMQLAWLSWRTKEVQYSVVMTGVPIVIRCSPLSVTV